MKLLSLLLSMLFLPLSAFSLAFGDANNSSMYYRVNDALISRAYVATNATIACLIKQYPDAETLPPSEENSCRLKNLNTSPFFIIIRRDGCVHLSYYSQGNPKLLAGKTLLTCPQVSTSNKIISFAIVTTYTNIGDNDQTNMGDTPLLFGQQINFAQALMLLGTDFSGAVFVTAALLQKKAAVLQALYEQYKNSTEEDETLSSQTAYIST